MLDIFQCKDVIEHVADTTKMKECKLLFEKWHILKELVTVLQIPYKATIALQKQDITLTDSYGIWLKLPMHLELLLLNRFKTKLPKYLLGAFNRKKDVIFTNPAMACALYLDPRFRQELLQDDEKAEQARSMLLNLWNRINVINTKEIEISRESSEDPTPETSANLSIDFDDSIQLNKYLEKTPMQNHPTEERSLERNRNLDIEMEINLFDPPRLSSNASILSYWESIKESNERLYQLATAIFAIPPTEVSIERDFSRLGYIFTNRRSQLSQHLLEDILLIHLNSDLFYNIKTEELNKIR